MKAAQSSPLGSYANGRCYRHGIRSLAKSMQAEYHRRSMNGEPSFQVSYSAARHKSETGNRTGDFLMGFREVYYQ